jgi:hypothetical protein
VDLIALAARIGERVIGNWASLRTVAGVDSTFVPVPYVLADADHAAIACDFFFGKALSD